MSDKMITLPIEKLYNMVMNEYAEKGSIFGIHKEFFFDPKKYPELELRRYGQLLESPMGVAAGPQTQLSQNIIAAWLTGSRYIELKTVQTLDEIEVTKPCIDMEDEGYNCEWSQELKLEESFHEYLNAWIMIHILREKLNLKNTHSEKHNDPTNLGTIFNMSVGYNLEGILKDNVQTFLKNMRNAGEHKKQAIEKLRPFCPEIDKIKIPDSITNNITLSTMHGCPPDEIEKIGMYLIENQKLHTTIKLNPTLNGPKDLRDIVNVKLGFKNVVIPDIAFEHDLKYPDAVKLLTNLSNKSKEMNLDFGIKLTNTLESLNLKGYFAKSNEMNYMSGRPIHALAINIAKKLQHEFNGMLDLSFSAGADAFNVAEIVSCNIKPVTVCSDLLKPGGYGRLSQYFENIKKKFNEHNVKSYEELTLKVANEKELNVAIKKNLDNYFPKIVNDSRYNKDAFPWTTIKGERALTKFDCIKAPCVETCPTNQNVPGYIYLASQGKFKEALSVIREENPFANVTGMACDHICEDKCTRMNYDNTVLIRDIKRYIASKENTFEPLKPKRSVDKKVAIVGGGPSGLSAAFYLAIEGFKVEIFEAKSLVGGMVTYALPDFRTYKERVNLDIDRIKSLGIKVHENTPINSEEKFNDLKAKFDYVYVAVGASKSKAMGIENENVEGVKGFLEFLEETKLQKITKLPKRVAVIGGGNSAIDAVRTAKRLMPENGELVMLYRRTVHEMPANREEIEELLEENINIQELTAPVSIIAENNKLKAIKLIKMKLESKGPGQRPSPVEIKGSEFEMEFDLIVKAIGQDTDVSFVEKSFESQKGLLKISRDNKVFAGGDVVRGPSSIIKGIADGKNFALKVLELNNLPKPLYDEVIKTVDAKDIQRKRLRRIYRAGLPKLALNDRNNFKVVVQTLSDKDAQNEAARCLLCDEVCDVCVTVCPNRANISYEVTPKKYEVGELKVNGGKAEVAHKSTFNLTQRNQTMNIGDFCNECGNCRAFCPTAGKPYTDKPKIYLTESAYRAENNNAYYFDKNAKTLKAKFNGKEFVMKDVGNKYEVLTDIAHVSVAKEKFVVTIEKPIKDGVLNLEDVAAMDIMFNAFTKYKYLS